MILKFDKVRSVRGESVEATGLQLQQTVLPVGSGNTEVMDGTSQDAEGFSLQSELWGVGPQTLDAAHSFYFRINPEKQNPTGLNERLWREISIYLVKHKHWSKQVNKIHGLYHRLLNSAVQLLIVVLHLLLVKLSQFGYSNFIFLTNFLTYIKESFFI